MAEKPRLGFLLLIPGLLLVLGGVLIFIEPKALVWLLAGTSIFIGLVMLFFAMFVRKMRPFHECQSVVIPQPPQKTVQGGRDCFVFGDGAAARARGTTCFLTPSPR